MSLVPVKSIKPQWYDVAGLVKAFFAVRAEKKAQAAALEAYKTEWIRLLSDDEIVAVFKKFASYLPLSLAERSPNPSTSENIILIMRSQLIEMRKYTQENRNRMNDDSCRKIYDCFNVHFTAMKNNFINSRMDSKTEFLAWADRTKSFLLPSLEIILPHPQMDATSGMTVNVHSELVDLTQQLSHSTLPKEIKSRILELDKEVAIKLTWSLDISTRHSLSSIVTSSVPEMIKAYNKISVTQDTVSTDRVVASILKQLCIVEKFISSIEQRFVSESVYSMNVQEKFLETKFSSVLEQ